MGHDATMRAWYLADIPRRHFGARVMEEVGIGRGTARVDIAAILPDSLVGFELKSAKDNLGRLVPHSRNTYRTKLDGQIVGYNTTFDAVTVAVERSDHVEEALTVVPLWWGVECFNAADGSAIVVRPCGRNPDSTIDGILDLLWLDEKKSIIKAHAPVAKAYRMHAHAARAHLIANVPAAIIRTEAFRIMRERTSWGFRDEYDPVKAKAAREEAKRYKRKRIAEREFYDIRDKFGDGSPECEAAREKVIAIDREQHPELWARIDAREHTRLPPTPGVANG